MIGRAGLAAAATSIGTDIVTAGTITGASLVGPLTGNASTATALQTARMINGVSFNGTADITVSASASSLTGTTLPASIVNSSLTSLGTLTGLTMGGTIDMDGSDILDASAITAATFSGAFFGALSGNVTGNVSGSSGSTTGNAGTATALQTARTINGTSFDGTANITVTSAAGTLTGTTLNSSVTASSLTSVGTLTGLTMGGTLNMGTNNITNGGSITATSFTGALSGNASTASALFSNPTDCGAGTFATAIDASGNLTCAAATVAAGALTGTTLASNVTASSLTSVGTLTGLTMGGTLNLNTNNISNGGSITATTLIGALTGNASTASALFGNPTDCGAGTFATAIDAGGNLTCSAATVNANNLTGTTLASGVVNSSLTSVGELVGLTTSGGLVNIVDGSGTVSLGSSSNDDVNVGVGNNSHTVNIGTGSGGTSVINIGTGNGGSPQIKIGTGSSNMAVSLFGNTIALNSGFWNISTAGAASGLTNVGLTGHLSGVGGAATSINGASNCSATSVIGTDLRGAVTATCSGGQFVTVNFATAYSTAPTCVLTPTNVTAATSANAYVTSTTSSFTFTVIGAAAGGIWNYQCIE